MNGNNDDRRDADSDARRDFTTGALNSRALLKNFVNGRISTWISLALCIEGNSYLCDALSRLTLTSDEGASLHNPVSVSIYPRNLRVQRN
jgi:hypothetical protein